MNYIKAGNFFLAFFAICFYTFQVMQFNALEAKITGLEPGDGWL